MASCELLLAHQSWLSLWSLHYVSILRWQDGCPCVYYRHAVVLTLYFSSDFIIASTFHTGCCCTQPEFAGQPAVIAGIPVLNHAHAL